MSVARGIAGGAVAVLALTVPVGVVTLLVDDEPSDSTWVALPFALILVGAAVAGAWTARRVPSRPMSTAAAAAVLAYLVVVAVAVVRWAVDGGDAGWAGLVAGGVVVTSVSVAGAAVGRTT